MSTDDLENRILELVQSALQPMARQIAETALAEAKREILARLDGSVSPSPAPAATASAPVALPPARQARRATTNRHIPTHCVYPNCHKPQKGPRFSFMCEEHMGVGKREKTKYLTEWKQRQAV